MDNRPPSILFVDTSEYDSYHPVQLLRDFGFPVTFALNADEALQQANGQFGLVVTRIDMPHGSALSGVATHGGWFTGFALAETLRQTMPELRFLLFSNEITQDHHDRRRTIPNATCVSRATFKSSDFPKMIQEILGMALPKPIGETMRTDDKRIVFISHSSKDADLAKALVDLLHEAFSLSFDRILCTSDPRCGLAVGTKVDETLRDEAVSAPIFISLLTPAGLASTYVTFELGARWGAQKSLDPILAKGANTSQLHGPLTGFHAMNSSDSTIWQKFLKEVGDTLGLSRKEPYEYQAQLDKVIQLAT